MGDPPRRRKPGMPSEQDLALWRHATRDARPLRRREPPVPPRGPAAPALPPAAEAAPSSRRELRGSTAAGAVAPAPPSLTPAPLPPAPAELAHGSLAGLDKRKAQRLRRGRLPIEARLDLHGLTRAEAHGALDAFVARSAAMGRRCVLIITGKGRGGGEAGELGVLRRQVPLWLNQPGLRDKVLAFDYARPEHGGHGAIYLLLRRRRDEAEP